MNDQPDAVTSDNTQHSQQTSMPSAGFEPAIPGNERPQTKVLDRAATETGILYHFCYILMQIKISRLVSTYKVKEMNVK